MKPKFNATNGMLCWDPETDQVAVIRWPDTGDRSRPYSMTGLACESYVREADFEQRKAIVFIEAIHLIVRDRCDPDAVHRALLNLEEYQDGLADDLLHRD